MSYKISKPAQEFCGILAVGRWWYHMLAGQREASRLTHSNEWKSSKGRWNTFSDVKSWLFQVSAIWEPPHTVFHNENYMDIIWVILPHNIRDKGLET